MVKSLNAVDERLDSTFRALADPTRRAILREVSRGERTVGQVAQPHRMSLAAVSKHLKVLEAADLITRQKRGSFQLVRLNAKPMREAERWLAYYEQFWNTRLDALQKLLEGDTP
jgi:DNA-binding transcriptional ArsR family regulator